ncbi:hypothetical protein KC354_g7985 [Hortaea werneckii]|nr:hypothetical protein KC354_g7985 [Hortaea werneckii]
MAIAFLPPLDFARSGRNLATAATQSASQTIQPDRLEDDGVSEYATTIASPIVSNANENASFAANTRSDATDECGPPDASKRKAGDNFKVLQPHHRFLRRQDTVNSRESKRLDKCATKGRGDDTGPECNTRMKRTWSAVSKRSTRQNEVKSYRCDIYATSSGDFHAALAECRQLVLEAEGKLLDDFTYPGGFLFQLPSNSTSPLANGDETAGGGRIGIVEWTKPFPQPLFNGLRLTPYGGAGELLVIPVPPHRSSAKQTEKTKMEQNEVAKKRVSSWVSNLATNYGRSMSYMS